MMTSDMHSSLSESPEFLANLFDSFPCGVIIVDEHREICAANRAFEHALGLKPGEAIGSCQGAVMGCINADGEHQHGFQLSSSACETCEARYVALKALQTNDVHSGRAHFQLNVDGRVEEISLTLNAAPFQSGSGRFAVVVIEDLARLVRLRSPREEITTLGMVGHDPKMEELFETIRQVGPLDVPVLIQGESGTGKELVADALHRESSRNKGLLVPVNCGALPDGLLESELFGHVKGAFTGAVRDKKGRFQLAHGGTIFLDEIGELSPQMQVKFLRVLQNGTFEPIGGERTVEVDARVICATNRDLQAEVQAGRFRPDLYYRLAVIPITVPPLRDRVGDIPDLVKYFLRRISSESKREIPGIARDTMECLQRHPWPGNVRELENAIRYGAIKSRNGTIETRHLPSQIQREKLPKREPPKRRKLDQATVREAIEATGGNKSEAARHLGVSRATLYRFLGENEIGL